ncbi:hypothetical protein QUS34_22810, partial [Xanthomonas citri pv. citri]
VAMNLHGETGQAWPAVMGTHSPAAPRHAVICRAELAKAGRRERPPPAAGHRSPLAAARRRRSREPCTLAFPTLA